MSNKNVIFASIGVVVVGLIAVLTYIKSSWPPKVLEAQKEVTLQQRN